MHFGKPLFALLLHLAAANAQCGTADACVLTETCSTITRTSPATTTYASCVPTPTCLGVYSDCISNGAGDGCCSGYCAATKCRPKYERWPSCEEDLVVGEEDEDCCYDHKNKKWRGCVGGRRV